MLQAIYLLVKQHEENDPKVEIAYTRAVKPEGNRKALNLLDEIFCPGDDWWRGFGVIPASGFKIKEEFAAHDAEKVLSHIEVPEPKEVPGCICGSILKGLNTPLDCKLFNKVCNPENPIGACMVSNEGACAAYYKYKRHE
jgi:hydrogenase expression/formation protein HypD